VTATHTVVFVSAADRAMRACQEASRELRAMVEAINADRIARGAEPLDTEITIPGEPIK
jgi:hypothetical protein